jgi:N-methylhydantoinase A
MERAIRVISVERGYDPREFILVAFGGAGPLHACALAKALSIPRVLVPELPGALSALGILLADTVRDYSKTVMADVQTDLTSYYQGLETQAADELPPDSAGVSFTKSVDLRYRGQGYEINVPAGPSAIDNFHIAHKKRYGYSDVTKAVEVVNIRLRVTIPAEPVQFKRENPSSGDGAQATIGTRPVLFGDGSIETTIYDRERLKAGDRLVGPAIVVEYSSTTVVPPGCTATIDAYRNLVIEVA